MGKMKRKRKSATEVRLEKRRIEKNIKKGNEKIKKLMDCPHRKTVKKGSTPKYICVHPNTQNGVTCEKIREKNKCPNSEVL